MAMAGSRAPAGTKEGQRSGARGGGGKVPAGPGPHQELTGDVGLAGGGPAASSGTCGGNGDGVGYSGHLGPIASTGR
jgi:hypothetical protein